MSDSGLLAPPVSVLIVSCSLDPLSQSRLLALDAARRLEDRGACVEVMDLQEMRLPAFDNAEAHDHWGVVGLKRAIVGADAVLIAAPVYNWSLGSAAKNMVEVTGATGENGRKAAWFDKFVTFLCAGGLPHSYTAYAGLASSMTLDFKCILNPYMVYATDRDFTDGVFSEALSLRMEKTLDVALELAAALRNRTYSSDWEI
jgi:NAD(P)H-dependent FMN reductase